MSLSMKRMGNPIVFGSRAGEASENRLTFYNHYDVQPAEPFELWNSDPWSAELRDGRIWGRESRTTRAISSRALSAIDVAEGSRRITADGEHIVEGEEEIGSITSKNSRTRIVTSSIRTDASGNRDATTKGGWNSAWYEGICYIEMSVQSVAEDQHPSRAIRLPNAAWRLTWALATLQRTG
ncbi:MAG: M20/M25/M40 family metallo-hydrolase [Thermomicrobiales bacterium]